MRLFFPQQSDYTYSPIPHIVCEKGMYILKGYSLIGLIISSISFNNKSKPNGSIFWPPTILRKYNINYHLEDTSFICIAMCCLPLHTQSSMYLFPYPRFSVINRTKSCQAYLPHGHSLHTQSTNSGFVHHWFYTIASWNICQCKHMTVIALPYCILLIMSKKTGTGSD